MLCLAGTLILTTSSANAAVISWIGGADDWFDGSKWSLGVPPGNLDDTQIDNGGSATADSGSAFYPGGGTLAETNDLNVGVRANPILLPPYGTGSLTLNAVGLSVGGDLHVGVTNAPSAVGLGSSDGSLATSGGVNNPGDVDVGGEAAFGLFVDGVGSGTATGTGSVAGNLTGMGSGGLIVGRTEGGGDADGTLTVSGDVADFTSLQVGVTGLGSTGNAVGGLNVGGTLSRTPGGGFISVGTVAGAGQSSGALSVTNGISGFASIGIGNGSADPNATGSTTGTLDVLAGGVHSGAPNGVSFEVGNTNAHGTAVGTANVTGDITGFGQIEVGNVRGNNSTGTATGQLGVGGGPVTASSMRVGVSEGGIGIATGIVSLDHTLVTLDTGLTLGDGSTLQMAIDGNNRGVDYAAFDAATAALDGILEVLFSFDPLSAVYDLIVSDSINGITGDFDSVSIFGLGIGTTYSYGIEIANIGGTDVEVYRLRVGEMNGTTVPEPGALLLLIAGLSGVLIVRSRRSETR
ncbi:MAG: PEP-CTERM sorting domain-containing protein [Chromatiaceae bacterium]|nr:PEP-CTERM sorting domain-containing protein [Chromatiaceae bacterium]MCP5312108.1 PEP-CTERM sorting domain-containing protein [Chromatiaceae bacterium]